jgi:hypothetical protein
VNVDLSIFRMAYREAESMGVAMALIAKKRQDLELRLLRERVMQGDGTAGATLESTLNDMDAASRQVTRALSEDGTGAQVDKTA